LLLGILGARLVAAGDPALAIAGRDTLWRSGFKIQLASQGEYEVTPENIPPLLEVWADGALLYQEARRQGLGDDETTQVLSAEAEKDYLVGLMSKRITDSVKVNQNEIYDYYNRRKLDFVTQLRFQYLVLPDEKNAQQTLNDLKRPGTQFKVLAQERSLERSSNPSAEMILAGRSDTTADLDPLLEDTIFALPAGKVSRPIKAGGQYWLVEVIERIRLRDTLPLGSVQGYISQFLELKRKRTRLEQVIGSLKKRARISLSPPRGDTTGFLAAVGDSILTRRRVQIQLSPGPALSEENLRRVVDVWVNSEILAQEARRLGVGTDETTKVLLAQKHREYIANLLIDRLTGSISVSSNEAFDYFQKHREDYLYDVRILHILSGSDSVARQMVAELRNGADFQALAKELSFDRAMTQGEESRYIDRLDGQSKLNPVLEEAIFSLKAGEISPVLHTNQGYWIVKVTDRKQVRNDVTFEQAKERVSSFLYQKRYRQTVDSLLGELKRANPPRLLPSNYWMN
jgi:parvulin-like peptidyl-prolyl isomerase